MWNVMRCGLGVGFGLWLGGCEPEPFCGDVQLHSLSVETSSGTPEFQWTGLAQNFSVRSEAGEDMWQLNCNCLAEERRPNTNAGCRETLAEFEFRSCLEGPVTYGITPDIDTLLEPGDYDETVFQIDARPLESGQTYEVEIQSFCRDPDNPSIERRRNFVAP